LEQLANGTITVAHTAPLVERFALIRGEIGELENIAELTDLRAVVEHLFPENDALVREIRALALSVLDEIGDDAERTLFLRELTNAIATPEIPTELEEVRVTSLRKSKGLSAPVTHHGMRGGVAAKAA
jgi:DNA helicase-2/ATP-dependent DNA helicase PcrA